MNLTELRSRLRRRVGSPDASQVADSILDEAINDAYQYILDRYPHSSGRSWFQFTTEAGVSTYELPGHLGAVSYVFDVAGRRRLRMANESDLAWLDGRPAAISTRWMRDGQGIILFPAPSAARTIGVRAKVTSAPLQDGEDEPIVDQTWHTGLLLRARYEFFDAKQDANNARTALMAWNEWVSTKPALIEEEVNDSASSIPPLERDRLPGTIPSRINSNVWGYENYGE